MTCDQRLMRLAARDGGHLMPEKCEAIALAAGGINSVAPTRSVHRVDSGGPKCTLNPGQRVASRTSLICASDRDVVAPRTGRTSLIRTERRAEWTNDPADDR
jgi:hypothetical protein